jgi:hypothetical protein
VPLEAIKPEVRERVQAIIDKPTLHARGPAEAFVCRPDVYHWLLDHPTRAVLAWRRLGAKTVEIEDRGGEVYGWSDPNSSDIAWETVYRDSAMRVWYAHGKVRPAAWLGLVPVEVVLVLQYAQAEDTPGRPVVHHQADFFLHTDSRMVTVATKLLGQSAPKMAEQYVAQMEMFYSALAWYLDQHPERMPSLLAPSTRVIKPTSAESPARP